MNSQAIISQNLSDQERSDIYNKYVDILYNYGSSLNFSQSACMDAIHDVFVQFFTSNVDIVKINIKYFLLRSLKNRLIDLYRRDRRIDYTNQVNYSFSMDVTFMDDLIEKEEKAILKAQVDALLTSLTDRQREAIYLRYFQELEYDEISTLLDLSAESARKLVYRAITKMRSESEVGAVVTFTFVCLLFKSIA